MIKLNNIQMSASEQVYPFRSGPSGQPCYIKTVEGTIPSADLSTNIYYNTSIDKVLSFDAFTYIPDTTYDRRSNPIPWVRRQYDVYNISIEIYTDSGANKEYVQVGNGPSGSALAGTPFEITLIYTKL